MRLLLTLTLGLAASALAACGGSSTTVVTTTQASAPASSSSARSSSTTTTASSTGSAGRGGASGPGAGSRCVGANLAVSFLGQQGATGHGELGFALRNTGAHSCHTFGYPGVLFLTASGAPLPTASTRTTHDFFGTAPETALTLAPGAKVSFRLGVTHGVVSSAGCRTAGALQVIAPDDTATLRVRIPGGAYECGTATVSPLQPATSAFR